MGNKIGSWTIKHEERELPVKVFYCKACKVDHFFDDQRWDWNGSHSVPNVVPGIRIKVGHDDVCHVKIKNGTLVYLEDSTHELSGKAVLMEDYE